MSSRSRSSSSLNLYTGAQSKAPRGGKRDIEKRDGVRARYSWKQNRSTFEKRRKELCCAKKILAEI